MYQKNFQKNLVFQIFHLSTVVQPTNRMGTLGYDLVWRHSGALQKTS